MKGRTGRAAQLVFTAGLALALAGCMTLGRPFPAERVTSLRVGTTTRDEVRAEFGEPYRTGVEDGDPTWTYLLYRFSAFAPEKTRDLYIRFDAAGKIKSYAFNTNEPDAAPR
ncbi:MAG TPA: outer membrane protein assembly factor BamE [Elusimicrobiota bacterium]|nr:outer membrane protein assembly factor BamE [Elusimicrobiota bacterium]